MHARRETYAYSRFQFHAMQSRFHSMQCMFHSIPCCAGSILLWRFPPMTCRLHSILCSPDSIPCRFHAMFCKFHSRLHSLPCRAGFIPCHPVSIPFHAEQLGSIPFHAMCIPQSCVDKNKVSPGQQMFSVMTNYWTSIVHAHLPTSSSIREETSFLSSLALRLADSPQQGCYPRHLLASQLASF